MKKYSKNILYLLFSIFSITSLVGCNEKLTIDEEKQGDPEITDFMPKTGKVGSEITIIGQQLRDVLSVSVGNVNAEVKYKISQTKLVVIVPGGINSGKITVKSKDAVSTSDEEFKVLFPVPSITTIPEKGEVEGSIEILGENMDIITNVLFGNIKASIIYQNDKELVVKVPFVLEDQVSVRLNYYNEDGEQTIKTDEGSFEIIKPKPELTSDMPANVNEGQTITLQGINLHLIEEVLFGEVPASISRKEMNTLTFRVPTLPETSTVQVKALYYEKNVELVLSEACYVFIPKVLYYPNLMIGAHRVTEIGNLFNATTGDVLSSCFIKVTDGITIPEQNLIDFACGINSGYDFYISGPQRTYNSLKNFWCDGKTFAKGTTVEALTNEGYGNFVSTVTKFLVLSPDNEKHAEIIDQVLSGAITEISPEETPALFNGSINPTQELVRSRKGTEEEGLTSTSIYKVNSVVVFKNEKKDKIGILHIKNIDVDYTQPSAYINSNSSVTFDAYYEREK